MKMLFSLCGEDPYQDTDEYVRCKANPETEGVRVFDAVSFEITREKITPQWIQVYLETPEGGTILYGILDIRSSCAGKTLAPGDTLIFNKQPYAYTYGTYVPFTREV